MRLLSRDEDGSVWHLGSGQRDLLLVMFDAAATRPGRKPGISRMSPELDARYRADLAENLELERISAQGTLTDSLRDPVRCEELPDGHRWRLDLDETETFLQALNAIRIGAWERLGCPDESDAVLSQAFQPGTVEFLDRWLFALSGRFLERVLVELEED